MMKTCVNTGSFRDVEVITCFEILGKMGFKDIEFNIRPVIAEGYDKRELKSVLTDFGFNIVSIAGGWCDFFTSGDEQAKNVVSVQRQLELADYFGNHTIRLFWGMLDKKYDSRYIRENVASNVRNLAEQHPDFTFLFESHDHFSLDINFLEGFFRSIEVPNVWLNYDAVNFERGGTDSMEALRRLYKWVAHAHVKGKTGSEISSLVDSEFKFRDIFRFLRENNYKGYLSLEYEAGGDIISNIYRDYMYLKRKINSER